MRCYEGRHEKESIKRSEAGPSDGAFCCGHDGAMRGGAGVNIVIDGDHDSSMTRYSLHGDYELAPGADRWRRAVIPLPHG